LLIFAVFVILPAAAFAFALWLAFTPTASEAAAAAAYRNAPACSPSSPATDCIKTERAEIVSSTWIPGKCGGHYDRFTVKLPDGVHDAQIDFDCLAPNPSYSLPDGQLLVREYRGQVTTVYDVNGKAYETTDSPIGGASWRGGVSAVMLSVFGAWLLAVAIIAIGVRFTNRARASAPKPSC
jgi:hypothetical protein